MLVAPAKLTWSLRVTGTRPDGYHLIDAEMVTLDLVDRIDIEPADRTSVTYTGPAVPPDLGDDSAGGPHDLVARALDLVDRTARVRVHKVIPAGAGLGGGSSDAAAILRWAGCTDAARAATIGADVPFCLVGGRARVSGVGEEIEPLPFEPRTLTLLTPPLHCSTPAVYRRWDELGGPLHPGGNDLLPAAIDRYPELGMWLDRLRQATGCEPRLAGSGSTIFVEGAHEFPGALIARTTRASGPSETAARSHQENPL